MNGDSASIRSATTRSRLSVTESTFRMCKMDENDFRALVQIPSRTLGGHVTVGAKAPPWRLQSGVLHATKCRGGTTT